MDGSTLQLTDSLFNDIIKQHELVLVDFWAPWCGPCLKLSPVMEQLASLYKGKAIIGKLNIDDNAETPSKYEIKTIPSILIFYEALQVERLVGNVPIDTIQLALNKYLFKEKF